jgi:enoyl-CoA hydratase/carnithine racemase
MTDKKYTCILFEKKDRVATITLNRPEVMNTINRQMADEILDALQNFKTDREMKVAILTGAGEKNFCAGADLNLFMNELVGNPTAQYEWLDKGLEITRFALERHDKPIIAAINGACLAGGLELALACDFMIAAENASFALTEVSIGVLPGWGGTSRFPKAIPVRRARELLYTADRFKADEAFRLGLVNRVVPQGQAYESALETAKKIAFMDSSTLKMAKKALTMVTETADMDMALWCERGAAFISSTGEGFKEGVAAFLEKRPPKFK